MVETFHDISLNEHITFLVLLHKILRGAMKCKQTVDTAQVAQVRELLHEFEHAYGK